MVAQKRVAVIVFLWLVGWVTATSLGQYTQQDETAPAWSYYSWILPAGDPPAFLPHTPPRLDGSQEWELKDGRYLFTFPTGAPGELIIDAFRNGPPGQKPIVDRLFLTVTGNGPQPGPDPDPDPDPVPLTGLAKQIYESAVKVGRPEDAKKIAGAYGSVYSAIAAGGILTLIDARETITKQMQEISPLHASWKPTGDLIRRAMNEFAQDMKGAEKTIWAISQGLEEAGK